MVSPEARESLRSHGWPGNVRELAHTLERAGFATDQHSSAVEILGVTERHLYRMIQKFAER